MKTTVYETGLTVKFGKTRFVVWLLLGGLDMDSMTAEQHGELLHLVGRLPEEWAERVHDRVYEGLSRDAADDIIWKCKEKIRK